MLLVMSGLLLLELSACGQQLPTTEAPQWHDVDVLFREFWLDLGGLPVIGPAAGPAFQEGDRWVQYFDTVKMVFDERLPRGKRFYLEPLGVQMGIYEPPVPPPTQPDLLYLSGHIIAPKLRQTYEALSLYAGLPLTELRYNPERDRYEQYFECLGLYYREGSDEVHLLSYGAWACGERCRPPQNQNGIIDISHPIDPLFEPFVKHLGADLTGFGLTNPYPSRDGRWEQVLENVVLTVDASLDPQSVQLRPLTQDLMIPTEPPRPYSGNPNMYFFPADGELGYEVPQFFWDYLLQHGGLELSGPPVTHFSFYSETAYRQCFTNFCLIYDLQLPEARRVHPEPLGYTYRKMVAQPSAAAPSSLQKGYEVRIWEQNMHLPSTQSQRLGITILHNNQPVNGLVADLILHLPGGKHADYRFPPTDASGHAQIDLPPIEAPNGTLIVYEVCLTDIGLRRVCYPETFLIWNLP